MINDNIIEADSRETYMKNMARYSLYILYDRYTPDIRDGLKPGQRRLLYAMYKDVHCVSLSSKRKSANTVGLVIAKYHPHGNDAVYGSMKSMTNWFEIKMPLINYDSNSGSLQGGPQAAMRYTESYLSNFTMDCVIGELSEYDKVVDWQSTFDNYTEEPEYLPVKVPLLLVNGCFGIAIGSRIESPKHSLNDVIDATIAVLRDPKAKVVLIPDPCQKCEVVDTDWKKISNTGYGYYIERGIIDIEHNPKTNIDTLHIRSTPDLIFYDSVAAKIEDLIKNKILIQIADIQDHSTEDALDVHIILKKGSDPNYVKQVLYKNTGLQDTKRVNMQVINGTEITRISYKAYISHFLEMRRDVKGRVYQFRLQTTNTRLHELETYIKILESGDVENIIHMIRNQSAANREDLINWLMNKLKITDVQAAFILNTRIGRLSKGNLKKYKEEQKELFAKKAAYMKILSDPKLIDQEIEQELLEIKAKYGKPRQSILISESQASNIPEGEFKIVITEQNYVKKLQVNDPIKVIKGDNPKCIIIADNSKDILLFDQMGKVFRLPVHKISFTDKSSPGLDIRMILKKLTSNIISVMYLPIIEHLQNKRSKYFVVTVTKNGLIKRMDIDDVVNATPSGIIYSKLNPSDMVCDILIANQKSDIVVYTKSKALRMPIDQIPYLKRATLGNQAIKSKEPIDGISVLTSDTKEVIIVTHKGRFNKLSQGAFERSDRNKAGSKVIKLLKGDYIMNIFPCSGNNIIRVTRPDEVLEINTKDIPLGSSVSQGVKLCKDGIIKAEMIRG